MAAINDRPPERLWHYTSGSAAKNIFQSRTLWAGHLGYMNDSSEVNLAMDLSRQAVNSLLEEFPHHRQALESWRRYLNNRPPTTWAPNTFAVSFSEEPDLLSQWRGYATGSGGPFSLGFPTDLLKERTTVDTGRGWALRRCIYDNSEQLALVEGEMRAVLIYQDQVEGPNEADRVAYLTEDAFRERVMSVAPLCKHSGFSEEREWRLVLGPIDATKLPQLHFVERRHTLAPYVEFSLADDDSSLSGVWWIAGPGPEQQRANDALGLAARFSKMNDYFGRDSGTPYLP